MDTQTILQLINNMYEIETKVTELGHKDKFERNINKFQNLLSDAGFIITNPIGEKYNETRTDIEANIIGKNSKNLMISTVMKPAVFKKENDAVRLIQKAVAIIE